MIDKVTVKRILDAADIVEVVSDYVHLTRRGANYMGLCPFHNERTPSFSVSPSRGICHCFSCGKGGSPVNFIMEKEGINFHDALLRLADKYGIKVEERELSDEERHLQSRREAMLTVNEWAMRRFRENMLATDEGRNVGLEYFYQRGITKEAIDKFKLGYALDKATDMYDAATRQGYDVDALKEVGLCGISQQSGKPYDRFRGRVIYPLINSAGKVIAFGGRGIKGEAAKYINSPESDLYHKSNELFGIYQAKNAIVRQKKCFLVEGYMDVIGMWQSGMENVVASSGTSLTDGQVALIHRFTENITIIYDGDGAGIHASLRAIDICLAHNIDVKLLLLPDGDDPDSFARKNTPEQFRAYVDANEQDFIAFQAGVLNAGAAGVSSRTETLRTMVGSLARVSDLIRRTVYIQECSKLMHVSEAVITAEVAQIHDKVVQAQRRRRQIARIEADKGNDVPAVPTSEGRDGENDALTSSPAAEVKLERHVKGKESLIYSVEKHLMEYVVRYGMVPFCSGTDGSGTEIALNVAEFVRDELSLDQMHFSHEFFHSLFMRILSMIPAFNEQKATYAKELSVKLDAEHNAWLQEMAGKVMTVSEIESAEQKRAEYRHDCEMQALHTFACEWIGRELGSDSDDNVRKFVLDTITPKYTLSKYHSKNMHIETDDERLDELIARAITEWKDAIIQTDRKALEEELRAATDAGDFSRTSEILTEIQQLNDLRREVAKNLGERILTPRR